MTPKYDLQRSFALRIFRDPAVCVSTLVSALGFEIGLLDCSLRLAFGLLDGSRSLTIRL